MQFGSHDSLFLDRLELSCFATLQREACSPGFRKAWPVPFFLSQLISNKDPVVARAAVDATQHAPPSMMQVSVPQLLDQLVQQRGEVPGKEAPELSLSRLDAIIVPVRRMFTAGPYDIVHARSPPPVGGSTLACTLQDLQESDLLEEASDLLHVKYLSEAAQPVEGGVWPVRGALYGVCQRPLVCLPTQLRPGTPCKNVIYLVDTGTPTSELSLSAFSALLGPGEAPPPRAARAVINGVHCKVQLCAPGGNHPDVPLLGADYLTLMGGVLQLNYKLSSVSLSRA